MRNLILLAIVAWMPFQAQAALQTPHLVFQAIGEGLSPAEARSLQVILARANAALPPLMKSVLGAGTIFVHIQTFSGHIMGQYSAGEIALSHDLLNQVASLNDPDHTPVDPKYAQNHQSISELAVASVIHELGHAYDFKNFQSENMAQQIKDCQEERDFRREIGDLGISADCQLPLNLTTSVSSQPDFLNALGFLRYGFLGPGGRQQGNFLELRNPDPYSWTNPYEGFAVNLEYFALDPEFACREPSLFAALQNQLAGFDPFPNRTCASSMTHQVMIAGDPSAGVQSRFAEIDASRIYAVDYLFAGHGNEMMSRFGHAMLRLIVCAPERTVVDEHCYEDIASHLVISYRASVEDFAIDNWKGLVGDYPSVPYVMSLSSILSEYTNEELREVTSLPLRLDRNQINKVVGHLIEQQWLYEGKYKFLTNNCAHEALNFLKAVLPENQALQDLFLDRPDTLFQKLQDIGLGDSSALQSKSAAQEKGLYFPSAQPIYDRALAELIKQNLLPSAEGQNQSWTIDSYVNADASLRAKVIQSILTADPKATSTRKALAASELLEDLALRRMKDQLMKQILRDLSLKLKNSASSADRQLHHVGDELAAAKAMMTLFRGPSHLLDRSSRYGIPTDTDVLAIAQNTVITAAEAKAKDLDQNFQSAMDQFADPALSAQLKGIQANFKQIMARMRPPGLAATPIH